MSKSIDPDGLDGVFPVSGESSQRPVQVRVTDPATADTGDFDDEDTTNVRPAPGKPSDWDDSPTAPGIPMGEATTRQLAQIKTANEDSEDSNIQLMIEPTRAKLRASGDAQIAERIQLEPPKPQPPPREAVDLDEPSGGGKAPIIIAALAVLGLVGFGLSQVGGGEAPVSPPSPAAAVEPPPAPPVAPEPTPEPPADEPALADAATDAQAAANAQAQADADAAAAAKAQADADAAAAAQAQADADAAAAAQAKADAAAAAQAQADADAAAAAQAKADADAKAKAEADAKAKAKAEADAKAKAEADARAKARAKAEADAKAKAEADARAKAKADAAAKARAAAQQSGDAAPLRFEYDDATPLVVSESQLTSLVRQLKQAGSTIVITGHTCNLGDPNYNVHLGYERARAVRELLVENGVPGWRIKVASAGDTSPITSNETASGRRQNRRVEIRIE